MKKVLILKVEDAAGLLDGSVFAFSFHEYSGPHMYARAGLFN